MKSEIQNAPPSARKVTVFEDIEISPFSECVIKATADLSDFLSPNGIVEPHPHAEASVGLGCSDRSQLLIGCTLVDTKRVDQGVPVRVMNITNESVYLHVFKC